MVHFLRLYVLPKISAQVTPLNMAKAGSAPVFEGGEAYAPSGGAVPRGVVVVTIVIVSVVVLVLVADAVLVTTVSVDVVVEDVVPMVMTIPDVQRARKNSSAPEITGYTGLVTSRTLSGV